MSLIVRPPSWANSTDSLPATPTWPGTGIVSGAANVDGTIVSVLPAVTYDIEFLVVLISGFGTAAANTATLVDIMVDPAGGTSWLTAPLIPAAA